MEKTSFLFLLLISCGSAFIVVPQEITTLIDFILKFLPPFRKATEQSRIGFGFAYGNHADFQTVVQFGPDKEKKDAFSTSKRRATEEVRKSLKLASRETSTKP
ncbi:uncharacterized protein LOC111000713 [Pieris rapae]|uniref:uncharacterized protein LOC111000713 n=1 Tax=Pieris rapae TaxID=64459 RepID=UPI001E27E621|nr:uncharacterized protein LOC111000713 [Pieris rapae]